MENNTDFAAFLCKGDAAAAHFTEALDFGDAPEEMPEEMIMPAPETAVEEERAMTQAELAARLSKRPGGK